MINIPKNQIQQIHNIIILKQNRNEISFRNSVLPILRKQWNDSISDIKNGNTNIDQNIYKYHSEMLSVFYRQYLSIGKEYNEFTNGFIKKEKSFQTYQKKDAESIFDVVFRRWAEAEALKEVVTIINPNTIKMIKQIISQGVEDGLSYGQIAKKMKDSQSSINRYRANVIARTEVHNVYSKSVDESIIASKIQIGEKEWVAFIDEVTRSAHAEVGGMRIPMNDYFPVGTDKMLYPGDSVNGSADNLIQCRCIVLYYT